MDIRERQLFFDDERIEKRTLVSRVLHPARTRGPVISAERAWEGSRVYCFGTVLRNSASGGYRMWYHARVGPGNEHRAPGLAGPGDMVCYATSPDGIEWERPTLGLVPFDGSKDTNIVFMNGHCPSVLFDPDAPNSERYRMVVNGWGDHPGYTMRHSADGFSWAFYDQSPMFGEKVQNEVMCLARDPRTRRFYAFHRRWADNYKPRRRVIAASWSDDFRYWSPARFIFLPDELDVRAGFSEALGTEFYDLSGFWYESQFVGVLPVFLVNSYEPGMRVNGSNQSPWDGPIEAQLVHGRDGMSWRRFEDRSPVIPRGEGDAFDAGCILGCASAPVVLDEEVRLYYTGVSTTHGGPMPPKTVSIGLASWRRDGFVSLRGGEAIGTVETTAFESDGGQLLTNVTADSGQLSVEVTDETGTVMPGYSQEECAPIHVDSVRHAVGWRGRTAIPAGRRLRLRFLMKNADLYSYWME